MCTDREFEMELLRRLVKDYTRATKKDESEIISRYSMITHNEVLPGRTVPMSVSEGSEKACSG